MTTNTQNLSRKNSFLNTRTMAKVAILSAIAFVLMLFDFPLPIAPSFYKLDFSEVAVLMGGFAMGPLAAVFIEGIKVILNLLFTGTSTAGVGEFANFLIGISFAVPASLIYRRNKSKKTAVIGLIAGTLCMAAVGMVMNAVVLLPMYAYFYQTPIEVFIGMGTAIISAIHDVWTFALFCVVPFNLVKGVIVSAITVLLYKHISPLLHR